MTKKSMAFDWSYQARQVANVMINNSQSLLRSHKVTAQAGCIASFRSLLRAPDLLRCEMPIAGFDAIGCRGPRPSIAAQRASGSTRVRRGAGRRRRRKPRQRLGCRHWR